MCTKYLIQNMLIMNKVKTPEKCSIGIRFMSEEFIKVIIYI